MASCPECGAAVEEQAVFCEECGTKLPVAPEPGQPAAPDEQTPAAPCARTQPASPAAADLDAGAPVPAPDVADADAEYGRAVHGALADGALDGDDRERLDKVRDSLQMPADQAERIEREAIDRFTGAQTGPAEDGCPVALEINDNHFFMCDKLGVLDFRLAGRAVGEVGARLSVETTFLGDLAPWQVSLRPGAQAREKMQVTPTRDGEILLNVILCCEVDGEISVWRAQPSLMILDPGSAGGNIQLNLDMSMHAGRNIGYGLSQRTELLEGLQKGLLKDNNDLMRQSFPDQWAPIELVYDEARTEQERSNRPVQVRPVAADGGPSMDRATLVPGQGFDSECCVVLLGTGHVHMGRNRAGNDVVLRVLPRSATNDQRSLQISGQHLSLALRPDGLVLTDKNSSNGTRLSGEPVRGEAQVRLDRPSEVDLGGGLQLRLVPFTQSPDPRGPSSARYAQLAPADELWRTAEQLGLRSLLIQRIGNLAEDEAYLVVYRWAELGTTVAQEIVLPDSVEAGTHVRIVRIGGRLWLESLATSPTIQADGQDLTPGQALPLRPGLPLTCGPVEGKVLALRQCGL